MYASDTGRVKLVKLLLKQKAKTDLCNEQVCLNIWQLACRLEVVSLGLWQRLKSVFFLASHSCVLLHDTEAAFPSLCCTYNPWPH